MEHHTRAARPSMKDVAALAGVSYQTVSRVINHSPDVSVDTRNRVRQAIQRLGYRPSNSARALASSRSRIIGVIMGGDQFHGEVQTLQAIETAARSRGLFVAVSMIRKAMCSQNDFNHLCDGFDELNVDAFIMMVPTDVLFTAACRAPVTRPRILLTATHGGTSISTGLSMIHDEAQRDRTAVVGIDQWGAMDRLLSMIAGYGHRTALYIAGPSQWRDATTRLEAWRELSAQYAISSNVVRCRSWQSDEAYAQMNHVLEYFGSSGAKLPTVIVTASDAQAIGVARALREHDIRIPQDVSLAGFDDIAVASDTFPPLTTIRPDYSQLGVAAMREALFLMGEGPEPGYPVSTYGVGQVEAKVVKRASLAGVSLGR